MCSIICILSRGIKFEHAGIVLYNMHNIINHAMIIIIAAIII